MTRWEQYKETMVVPRDLWFAARENDVTGLASLLDAGADIDARDHRGFSPLMLAAYAGNVDAFDYLIGRGANPNSADDAGNTILMGAAYKGHVAFVEKLLGAGARRSATNDSGVDARTFAITFGRSEVVDLLDGTTISNDGMLPGEAR